MLDFFRLMLPVVLFRRGPQDMPYSPTLFALAVFACTMVVSLVALAGGRSIGLALAELGAALAVFFASVALLLRLFDKRPRLLQTLTAALGASVIVNAIQLLLTLLAGAGLSESTANIAMLAVFVWAIAIDGFILGAALEVSALLGCLLALTIVVAQASVLSLIAPASVGAG